MHLEVFFLWEKALFEDFQFSWVSVLYNPTKTAAVVVFWVFSACSLS